MLLWLFLLSWLSLLHDYDCYLLLQVACHHLNQILWYLQIPRCLDHHDRCAGSVALPGPPHPLRLLQRVKHTCWDNHVVNVPGSTLCQLPQRYAAFLCRLPCFSKDWLRLDSAGLEELMRVDAPLMGNLSLARNVPSCWQPMRYTRLIIAKLSMQQSYPTHMHISTAMP